MVAITKLYTQKVEPILDSEPWEPCFRFFCLLKKHQNTYYSLPLPETSSSPLKIGNLKRKLVPTNRFFRCYVGLREANYFLLLPLYIYTLFLWAGRICRLFCCGNRLRASNKSLDGSTKGQGSTHSMRILVLQRIPPPSRNTGLSKGLSTTSCLSAKPY